MGSVFVKKMFRKPRLVVDWQSLREHHGSHIATQEIFFSCCFAMMMGGLRVKLASDQNIRYFSYHFGILWSLVSNASDYATRFNDDDLWHTFLWGGYGIGLVGIMMHINESAGFHIAVATTEIWMALAWIRIAVALPRCRIFALYFCFSLCAMAGIVLWVGVLSGLDDTWLSFLPLLVQPTASIIFAFGAPNHLDIPMNIEYHVPKFAGMGMLVMGQLVGASATVPRTIDEGGPVDIYGFYGSAFGAVVMLISFKLIYGDCDVTLNENHAIRRSRFTALTWLLLCQPWRSAAVASCAAGISILLNIKNVGERSLNNSESFGTSLFAYSASMIFLCAFVTEILHKSEGIVTTSPLLRTYKRAWFCALIFGAIGSALLPKLGIVYVIPFVALMSVGTAAIGILAKEALLKARQSRRGSKKSK